MTGSANGTQKRIVAILFFVALLNFLDRQILTLLAEPIKAELKISDTQIGLMTGLAFATFYATLSIPIAALADRWNRGVIIGWAVAIWSTMTLLCGLASNFTQLLLARLGVGFGEAGSGPASQSLIADIFPPDKRSGALGTIGTAVPIAAFIAYAGGGWVVEQMNWRAALLIAGLPGLPLALVIWFAVKDPRGKVPLREALRSRPGDIRLREALADLARKPAYWHLVAAGVLVQFVAYGLGAFYGSYFVRVHQLGYAELGWKLGLMIGVAGAGGAWIGGRVGDRFARTRPELALLVTAACLVLSVPSCFLAFGADSAAAAFLWLSVSVVAATFYYGPTFATIQGLASDRTRAMAVAIYFMIASLIGLGLGPVFVGALSDHLGAGSADGLRAALSIAALFNLWAGLHYWLATRALARPAR
jgi:predicted MFS family arabinose efflux permease